jgi:hypothetical protein
VAVLAFLTITALVYVIQPMTAITISRLCFADFSGFPFWNRVATVATELAMLSAQGVIGVPVVVELTLVPFIFVMAILALIAKALLVDILDRMAGYTGMRRILVSCLDMTEITCHFLVGEPQFEIGFVMVELIRAPAFRVVAILAFLAHLPLMHILLTMTVDTVCRCIAIFFIRLVTTKTFGLLMATM